jgi:hypothetical protein
MGGMGRHLDWLFSFLTVPFVLLLFTEGRLLSPRWRWAVWWSGASLTAVIVLVMLAPRDTVSEFATSGLVSKLPVTNPLFGDRFAELVTTYRLAPYLLSAASYLPALIGLCCGFSAPAAPSGSSSSGSCSAER